MKLETRKEAIQAILEGKSVVDSAGKVLSWDKGGYLKDSCGDERYITSILTPCSIKEEPEILYEVAYSRYNDGDFEVCGMLKPEKDLPNNAIKLRAFIVADGQLKEHKA